MTTDLVDITKSVQEQFFGTLTAVQDTVLESYAKFVTTAEKYVPAELRPPVKDLPIDPKAFVDLGFGFAAKLGESQKSFVEKFLGITPTAGAAAPKAAAAK